MCVCVCRSDGDQDPSTRCGVDVRHNQFRVARKLSEMVDKRRYIVEWLSLVIVVCVVVVVVEMEFCLTS